MSADRSDAAVTAAVGGPNGAIGGPGDIGGITDTGITGGIGIAGDLTPAPYRCASADGTTVRRLSRSAG